MTNGNQDLTALGRSKLTEGEMVAVYFGEGRETLAETKHRLDQGFFRKMIMEDYGQACCVCGLNVPEVLRASHISPWNEDRKNRMNPANGLCLSATYDAAFDRYLISFDEDYRLILAKSLREYCTNESFKEYFLRFEGKRMALPERFKPDQELLKGHRGRQCG